MGKMHRDLYRITSMGRDFLVLVRMRQRMVPFSAERLRGLEDNFFSTIWIVKKLSINAF